jgi:NitT/TauT family transport system ATP-binding protein
VALSVGTRESAGPGSSFAEEAGLVFNGVAKQFRDGTVAIEEFSASISPGEFVAIVGPSGCGKSTLLRIASGLTPPSAGTVSVDREQLGYVFHDPTLLPWRTTQKNVELFGELHDLPKEERRRRASEAIALTGLEGFEAHRPRALSGGMRMRVSLARSLTLRPRVFLFDEPFGALDEITRGRLNGELQLLFERQRFAGLLVTHSVMEAIYLSTRVLVMSPRPGRIVTEVGVPFEYPRREELRFNDEFVRLAETVSVALREGYR